MARCRACSYRARGTVLVQLARINVLLVLSHVIADLLPFALLPSGWTRGTRITWTCTGSDWTWIIMRNYGRMRRGMRAWMVQSVAHLVKSTVRSASHERLFCRLQGNGLWVGSKGTWSIPHIISTYNGFTEALGVLGPCGMQGKHGGE